MVSGDHYPPGPLLKSVPKSNAVRDINAPKICPINARAVQTNSLTHPAAPRYLTMRVSNQSIIMTGSGARCVQPSGHAPTGS
jgi:hypothetical protein